MPKLGQQAQKAQDHWCLEAEYLNECFAQVQGQQALTLRFSILSMSILNDVWNPAANYGYSDALNEACCNGRIFDNHSAMGKCG